MKSCENCVCRSVCKVRHYFLAGEGSEHIRSVAKSSDHFARFMKEVSESLAMNCSSYVWEGE